jgi:hypothetical protein
MASAHCIPKEIAMRRLPFAALVLAAALPARADLAADYAALFDTVAVDLSRDPEAQLAQTEARIQAMAGRWIAISVVAGGGPPPDKVVDDAQIAKLRDSVVIACSRNTINIVPTSPLGFSLSSGPDNSSLTAQFQFGGGMEFVAVFDEASLRRRYFGDKIAEVPAATLYGALTRSTFLGRVTILPVGRTLLVVMPERQPPEVWARCDG